MKTGIDAELSKSEKAVTFARSFVGSYLSPAFGSRSKSETDMLVFSCLVEAEVIDPKAPIYEIARSLNVTPSRARNLVMNWELRTTPAEADLQERIVEAVTKTQFAKDSTLLTFGVESPLLKEEIVARLKRRGVFPDSSFAKDLVRLPVEAFVEFLDDLLDAATKKTVTKALVEKKLLPDKTFKGLMVGVLSMLGKKVAGEVGGEIAKRVTEFVVSVIQGRGEDAANLAAG